MSGMNAFMRTAIGAHAPVVPAAIGPVHRIDIIDDIEAAAPIWRGLERDGAVSTPYQRYDFIAPWQRHVGQRLDVMPFLVVGTDRRGSPLFLMPLGRTRIGPLDVAGFLGGKHANFNYGLWNRGLLVNLGPTELNAILRRIAKAAPQVDLLVLTNQPLRWAGAANPFAQLAHQPSPSFGYRGSLAPDFAALAVSRLSPVQRKKLRKKERVLAAIGPLRYWRIDTPQDAARVLDAFFAQKSERMAEFGIADAFSAPGMRDFIAAAATERLADGCPAIELYALAVGDVIAATYAGLVADGRFCAIFNSIIRNGLAHESPGQLLLANLVRMCCERGLNTFDLGVGEATFKQLFCDEPEPLIDSFLPLTPIGRIAAAAWRIHAAAKGRIKRSPAIWGAVQAARRRMGGVRRKSEV
jgi:CelD/BcsL family acetyltransferase involved in cellulose biosynthesis